MNAAGDDVGADDPLQCRNAVTERGALSALLTMVRSRCTTRSQGASPRASATLRTSTELMISARTRQCTCVRPGVEFQRRNSHQHLNGHQRGMKALASTERFVKCRSSLSQSFRRRQNAARKDFLGAAFCLIHTQNQLAARRLTLDSASLVSFLSAAFSSPSVFCSTLAQSLRPSCCAHAIRLP
jgi:hypothetical protein